MLREINKLTFKTICIIVVITAVFIGLLVLKNRDEKRNGEIKFVTPDYPVIRMKVIRIPSAGEAVTVQGQVLLKNRESNEFFRLYGKERIGFHDIIHLKYGASITMIFTGKKLKISAPQQEMWFTFETEEEKEDCREIVTLSFLAGEGGRW